MPVDGSLICPNCGLEIDLDTMIRRHRFQCDTSVFLDDFADFRGIITCDHCNHDFSATAYFLWDYQANQIELKPYGEEAV